MIRTLTDRKLRRNGKSDIGLVTDQLAEASDDDFGHFLTKKFTKQGHSMEMLLRIIIEKCADFTLRLMVLDTNT